MYEICVPVIWAEAECWIGSFPYFRIWLWNRIPEDMQIWAWKFQITCPQHLLAKMNSFSLQFFISILFILPYFLNSKMYCDGSCQVASLVLCGISFGPLPPLKRRVSSFENVLFLFSFSLLLFLPTFRGKVGFGFDRRSTVGVGSKSFGCFKVRGLGKNHFYDFIYKYEYIYLYILCTNFVDCCLVSRYESIELKFW